MKIIFSPTKTQQISHNINFRNTTPFFKKESQVLVKIIQSKSKLDLSKILKTSVKITDEVFNLYKNFNLFSEKVFAIELFSGTSFKQLDILNYSNKELHFLQKNICIMSGLYGILKPFDRIQKYRLDFENKLFIENKEYSNLFDFWNKKILDYFQNEDIILNLASDEYSKNLRKFFPQKIYSVFFLENKNGNLKLISMSIKKQRGRMLDYIIKNNIKKISLLKKYKNDGYVFNHEKSDKQNYYFIKSKR